MSCPFSEEQLAQLKAFVDVCKSQPLIIQHPKLSFFKDYLQSFGINLPIYSDKSAFEAKTFPASGDNNATSTENAAERDDSSDEDSESDVELQLDMEGVIEPDILSDSQDMGGDDPEKECTEEEHEQSDVKRLEAMQAFSEQKYEEALGLYTEAIKLNPQSALLFAKRGQVYLKLNKPNASIKDCTRALELNCDSATAYKFRGRAYRLLGMFEEASQDLCESLKIDYDEQTNEWLTEVKPNAEKLRQHKMATQRKKEEKEHRERLRRARKSHEARSRAAPPRKEPWAFPDGMDLNELLLDQDIMAAFQDPEVATAFLDVSGNPANFVKYQDNPKVAAVIEKLQNKFKGAGGKVPPGFEKAPEPDRKAPSDDDVGLD